MPQIVHSLRLLAGRVSGVALMFGVLLVGCSTDNDSASDVSPIDSVCLQSQIDALPIETLSAEEAAAISLMREEEKLARDVYRHLARKWGLRIFSNIVSSEQTHMDAVLALIERYALVDPAAGQPDGGFNNTELQALYSELTTQGERSLVDALRVGATIEDLDIFDLQSQRNEVIDNADITVVWESLEKGSRNHLRSFIAQIDASGDTYAPAYISQATFDEIVYSPREQGGCQ